MIIFKTYFSFELYLGADNTHYGNLYFIGPSPLDARFICSLKVFKVFIFVMRINKVFRENNKMYSSERSVDIYNQGQET